jgi:hypothetical protein
MHNPELEKRAVAYVASLGGGSTWSTGELQRHLVAFAEGELKGLPCIVCGGSGSIEFECESGCFEYGPCPLGCGRKGG